MNNTKDTAATPQNFCLLGALDDARSAYEQIMECHDDVIESLGVDRGFFEANKTCKPKVKKILSKYFSQHITIFTDEYLTLHPNDESLQFIFFLDIKRQGLLKFSITHMSFKRFLIALELIAARLIWRKKLRAQVYLSVDDVLDLIDSRISSMASKKWSERKTDMLEMGEILPPDLYVFKSLPRISCNRNGHSVLLSEVVIPLVSKTNKAVLVPIHQCETCGRKFIGQESYKIFMEEYGIMVFCHHVDESISHDSYLNFREESKLHSLGYNVVDGVLSERDRHNLLVYLLDRKIMNYYEICRDIENAINIFSNQESFFLAIKKWRDDLRFIGEHVLSLDDER